MIGNATRQGVIDKAVSEERSSNFKFARGYRWARVWSALWSLIAVTTYLAERFAYFRNEGVLPSSSLATPDSSWVVVLIFVVMYTSLPLTVFNEPKPYHGFTLLLVTALYSRHISSADSEIIVIMSLALPLLVVLTALMFFQPSIRYQARRLREIYWQNPKKAWYRLWP